MKWFVTASVAIGTFGTVKADSISYTNSISGLVDWTQQLGFSQFNANLGELQSVTLSLSAGLDSTFTITNTGGSTYGLGSSARRSLDIYLGSSSPIDLAIDAKNPNGTGYAWLSALSNPLSLDNLAPNAFVSGTRAGNASPLAASYTDSTTLGYFTGSGTALLDLRTVSGFSMVLINGSSYDSAQSTLATVDGVVTYNFVPVPEPSTFALAGFGLLSLLLIRRHKA